MREGYHGSKINPYVGRGNSCCYLNDLIEHLSQAANVDLQKGDLT